MDYLCHVISVTRVVTDESKVAAMSDWPQPVNIKELHDLLGLSSYYRKFVHNYGTLSIPLSNFLANMFPFRGLLKLKLCFSL